MIRTALLLLCTFLPLSASATTQTDQIKRNAQFVSERFGPSSGVANFGCNNDSIKYLDSFIARQSAIITQDLPSKDRFVSLLGSFLGECTLAIHGGNWVETPDGMHIEVAANGNVHIVRPFQKIAKRIEFGDEESLLIYFREPLPVALSPSGVSKPVK